MNKDKFKLKQGVFGKLSMQEPVQRAIRAKSQRDRNLGLMRAFHGTEIVSSEGNVGYVIHRHTPEKNRKPNTTFRVVLKPGIQQKLDAIKSFVGVSDAKIELALDVNLEDISSLKGRERRIELIDKIYEIVVENQSKTTLARLFWKSKDRYLNDLTPQEFLEENKDDEALSLVVGLLYKTIV